jgi:SMC interacting uncharacterized protein involved in chromosome segregation
MPSVASLSSTPSEHLNADQDPCPNCPNIFQNSTPASPVPYETLQDRIVDLNHRLFHSISEELELEEKVRELVSENETLRQDLRTLDDFVDEQCGYIEELKGKARDAYDEMIRLDERIDDLEHELKTMKEDAACMSCIQSL